MARAACAAESATLCAAEAKKVSVASIAYWLQFGWQIREGLFYALILAAPLVPLLDKLRPSARFLWPQPQKA